MHNTSTNEGDNRSFEQRLVFLDVDCEGWKSNDIRLTMDIKSAVFEKGGSSAMLYKRSAAARAGAFLLLPPPSRLSLIRMPKARRRLHLQLESFVSYTSESPAPPHPSSSVVRQVYRKRNSAFTSSPHGSCSGFGCCRRLLIDNFGRC